ncbi:MAG TPA: SH3 domain-containing protein [Roseovarius sp.]
MWRFILICFGFLGFAFYELSGGADYKPAPNSLQIAMQNKPFFAPPREVAPTLNDGGEQLAEADDPALPPIQKPNNPRIKAPAKSVSVGDDADRTQTTFAGLSGIGDSGTGGIEITLASAAHNLAGGEAIGQRPIQTVGTFNAESLVQDVNRLPIEQALVARQQPADIRSVAGSNANMRSGPGTGFDKLDQLSQGTQVEVLDRRGAWVELRNMQTGQTGWMADWLITAAN